MSRALLMLLDQPRKAHDADCFASGLKACGYSVHSRITDPKHGDLVVTWNRMGHHHTTARDFERRRARVIVAENGYLGASWRGARWYAMANNHHNGAGTWLNDGPDRWDHWEVPLEPMRGLEGECVMLAQRGIGEPDLRSPERWMDQHARQFKARIRRHPGTSTAGPSLEQDLAKASSVVTWSSGAAIRALMMGVHVRYGMPNWIAADASSHVRRELATSDRRLPMFRRLAWAMWTEAEVAAGEPFRRLLQC